MRRMIFPSNSALVTELSKRIIDTATRVLKSTDHRSIIFNDETEIPKRLGAYEIPIKLKAVNVVALDQAFEEFFTIMNDDEIRKLVKHLLKDTRRKDKVEFSIMLVSHCKKAKSPGVVVYWER